MNIQKKMIRQRMQEQQAKKAGESYDKGITFGIWLCCLALNREFGFGRGRMTRLDKRISSLLDDITQGKKPYTQEYQYAVERGMELVETEVAKIMGKEESD